MSYPFGPAVSRLWYALACSVALLVTAPSTRLHAGTADIPLPEHPRPDFARAAWLNLNGPWQFAFENASASSPALRGTAVPDVAAFRQTIRVPFGWGSPLSGVPNEGDIAWYRRGLTVPEAWRGQRIFVVIGASDWLTQGWFDGHALGQHQGGYTPFEFEITDYVTWGHEQPLALRVDDAPRPYALVGKQGYGNVRGLWQTVYLEARPNTFVRSLHFAPDIDQSRVLVHVLLNQPAPAGATFALHFRSGDQPTFSAPLQGSEATFIVPLAHPHLWSLDDPFLYDVDAVVRADGGEDRVSSYFGYRKVGVMTLPGTDARYVALNGKPVYLQLTLDQSYHPDGYYTFPSDAFMRDEILRSKRLGLNGNRIHIKVEVPRKLYWADRLGLLIMADVPNFWGDPTPAARQESEATLRGMIDRDFNHPAIFSWVTFNETWGLFTQQTNGKAYLPETQQWVISMYRLAKQLDPTRLVEDNSACNYDHTETDLNSWHVYLPGYAWRGFLDQVVANTHPGSTWNFIGGRTQGDQPMLNSECGNVWGYEGSTGDVDWSWDYHIMMNEFRRHPKVAGWLYTEHHDVINEWNGYYRFDRSAKFPGLDAFVDGMSLRDLHAPFYLSTGSELCTEAAPGATVNLPLFASFLTDRAPSASLRVHVRLHGWNRLGEHHEYGAQDRTIAFSPWLARELPPLPLRLPDEPGLIVAALTLTDEAGNVLHRNFTTFLTSAAPAPRDEMASTGGHRTRLLRFAPSSFTATHWSLAQWNVLNGLKVDGAGTGFFEYRVAWPANLTPADITGAALVFEASAKQLYGKDRAVTTNLNADFMRGEGSHDRSANPNSYPMTSTETYPSRVRVRINGIVAGTAELPNDPADHRGVLSWHAQPHDKKLREAGSYGWLVHVTLPPEALPAAQAEHAFVIRLEVDDALPGGLALYGERFGRYPLDPTLVFNLR